MSRNKLILFDVRSPNEFPAVGTGFQKELIEVLKGIWENQQFLDNKDLEKLKNYTI